MSYQVKIRHTADSGDGVSVEALVEGEPVAHTFPKGMGFFEENSSGKPRFVEKLEEKYEEKMKREGKAPLQETTSEESKIHNSYFENRVYKEGSEKVKGDNNFFDSMENVDLESPEQISSFLKENMAEGYLSNEEEQGIDAFIDKYSELLKEVGGDSESDKNFEKVVRNAYTGKVL